MRSRVTPFRRGVHRRGTPSRAQQRGRTDLHPSSSGSRRAKMRCSRTANTSWTRRSRAPPRMRRTTRSRGSSGTSLRRSASP